MDIRHVISPRGDRILISLVTIAGIALWVLYLHAIDVDVLFSDQLEWIPEYDQFVNGGLTISDLWNSKEGHRLPGYKLLFFLNCWALGFSPMVDSMLGIIPFCLAVSCLAFLFVKELKQPRILMFLLVVVFIVIALNGQTFRLSRYSLITTQLGNYAGFLVLAFMAYKLIYTAEKKSLKPWLLYGLGLCVFLLLFGRGYAIPAAGSIMALCILSMIKTGQIKRSLTIIVLTGVSIPVYMIGLNSARINSIDKINLLDVGHHALLKFGNANMGMFSRRLYEKDDVVLILAIALLFINLAGLLFVVFKKRLSLADWMALFIIFMAILTTLSISGLRSDQSPYYPRHNMEISLGLLGTLYFVFRFLLASKIQMLNHVLTGVLSITVLGLLLNLQYKNYKRIPNIRANIEKIEELQKQAYNAEAALDRKSYRKIGCLFYPVNCHKVFMKMKEHHISAERLAETR